MSEVVATSFGMVCAYRLFWWAIVNSQGTTISANLDWTVNHLRLQDLVRGNKGENGGHVFLLLRVLEIDGFVGLNTTIGNRFHRYHSTPENREFSKNKIHKPLFSGHFWVVIRQISGGMFSPLFPSFKFQQGTFRKQQGNLDVLELTSGMNQHKQHFLGPGKQPLPFMSINLKPLKPANPVWKSRWFPGRNQIFGASEVLPAKKWWVFVFCKTSWQLFHRIERAVWRFVFATKRRLFLYIPENWLKNHH